MIDHCMSARSAVASHFRNFTCARLEFEGGSYNPLTRALPPLIALSLARVSSLNMALELLFAETDHVRCGQRLLVDRIITNAVKRRCS
jgi:hypothetical protein